MNLAHFDNEPNGHRLIMLRMFWQKSDNGGRNGRVILAQAPESLTHRYVVAIQYEGDGVVSGWCGGQYFEFFDIAVDAFNKRHPKVDINPGKNFRPSPKFG
jgi:hypothetical protein